MNATLLTPPPAPAAAPATRLVVLFVDDEARLLEGIVRMLRPLRNEWDVLTANGGDEALAILQQRHVDVLVSDMRMPGMNGAELLDRVTRLHPGTIRMILSGQADRESLLRSIGSTHRYLAKPCDATQIRRAIHQAQDCATTCCPRNCRGSSPGSRTCRRCPNPTCGSRRSCSARTPTWSASPPSPPRTWA